MSAAAEMHGISDDGDTIRLAMPEILSYESPSGKDLTDLHDLIGMHRLVGWLLIALSFVYLILLAAFIVYMRENYANFDAAAVFSTDEQLPLVIDAACSAGLGVATLASAKWIAQRRHRALSLFVAAVNLLFCLLIFPGFLAVRTFRILGRPDVKMQYRETMAT
jgi:hypothetical protein